MKPSARRPIRTGIDIEISDMEGKVINMSKNNMEYSVGHDKDQLVIPEVAVQELAQAEEDLKKTRQSCSEAMAKILYPKDGTIESIRHARDIASLVNRIINAMAATERISVAWSMSIKKDDAKKSTIRAKCLIPTMVTDPDLGTLIGNNVRTFEF